MVEAFNVELAERIGSARKIAGKTQQQIADALAIHVNQYQRLEAGKHRVSAYDLTRIASAIGVPAGDLLPPAPAPHTAGDCLPKGHVILEQTDTLDGRVSQTVRAIDGSEYERIVHADEAYGAEE